MSVREKTKVKSDPIWMRNPDIILKRYTEFFPTKMQTREERINSLVRMSLYGSVVLALYHSNVKYFAIFLFFLLFTYMTYRPQRYNENIENIENTDKVGDKNIKCTKPTSDNPFMNATMKDYMNINEYGEIEDRGAACDLNDPEIKKQADTYFNNNLYIDVSDLFGKLNAQRNFYTMPSTTIPNDRESFQNWLYNTPQTCKENQDYCDSLNYQDLRANRFVFYEPEKNPISTKKMSE